MKLDDLNLNVNSNKVSKLLDDKFGTKVNLGSLNLQQLNRLKESVARAHAKTVKSMPFNSGHRNPEYLEQVALLEAIELRIGEIEEDVPTGMKQTPGMVSQQADNTPWQSSNIGGNLDALNKFVPKLGAIGKQIYDMIDKSNLTYKDKKGLGSMLSHFGAFATAPRYEDAEDWFEHAYAASERQMDSSPSDSPELKTILAQMRKLVHGIMWHHEQVNEAAPKSWEGSMNKEKEEKTPAAITGSQSSALLRLVGSKNIVKAKRAIQLANQGKTIPANLVTGFKPIVDMLLDILQGGPSYVNRLKALDKQALGASGLNESSSFTVRVRHGLGTKADYKKINVSADDKEHASAVAMKKAKKLGLKNAKVSSITLNESFNLFEGETEKAQLIMAVKDMVDRVQGMVEDLSKMKVEDLVALTDKMRDEFGQEQAAAFTTSADGILSAGIDNLTNARTEMDNAVLTLTGQAPAAAPGAELGAEQPAPAAGAELGAEMPAPEAGAELPAPEGGEEVGRELRESKVRRNIRSSNRFLATLAK